MPHPKLTEVFNQAVDLLDIQPAEYEYTGGTPDPETRDRAIYVWSAMERQRALDEVRKQRGGSITSATFIPGSGTKFVRVSLKEDEIWATNTFLTSVNQLVFTLGLPRATVPVYAEHRDCSTPEELLEQILAYIGRR